MENVTNRQFLDSDSFFFSGGFDDFYSNSSVMLLTQSYSQEENARISYVS